MPKHEVPEGLSHTHALTRRQFGLAAGAAGAGLMLPGLAQAADPYPSRTVMIVAPAAAGGPTDTIGRAEIGRASCRERV